MMREACRLSPFEARMRPAISPAGTSDGASRNASLASASALSGSAASKSRASAVSSTARRRSDSVLVDMAVLPGDGERVERAFVVARARLQVEQRVDAPGELRIALDRLLGERAGRLVVVAARGFEEQTAQPEKLGLGAVEHGLEGAPRRVAVAFELRRLRPQQRRQRLARQIAAGDAGIALRQGAVADADGEQTRATARHSLAGARRSRT